MIWVVTRAVAYDPSFTSFFACVNKIIMDEEEMHFSSSSVFVFRFHLFLIVFCLLLTGLFLNFGTLVSLFTSEHTHTHINILNVFSSGWRRISIKLCTKNQFLYFLWHIDYILYTFECVCVCVIGLHWNQSHIFINRTRSIHAGV